MQSHCTTPCTKPSTHSRISGYYGDGCRCEECHAAMLDYAQDYREKNRAPIHARNAKLHALFTARLRELRDAAGCADDGPHGGDLSYHHLDPSTKECMVSDMWSHSQEKVDAEIAKCVVLCASCHQRRHLEENPKKISFQRTPAL